MPKKFFCAAFVLAGILIFTNAGCSLNRTISRFSGNPEGNKIATSSADLASSTVAVADSIETTILKFDLNRFKNKKWAGEIKQTVDGIVGWGLPNPYLDNRIMVSINFTMEIDEMNIDFDNLSWAIKAEKMGIANTASSTAISIVGKGRIKFQNPWRTFFNSNITDEITSNPLPISFAGYIDFENNKLMPLEQFTNHPILSLTQTTCWPKPLPLGCTSASESQEWEADKLWLRGMTFELGTNDDLILKKPIWNLAELIWERQMIENTPSATLNNINEIKMEASGLLKLKSY